jgi:hypothetical protein
LAAALEKVARLEQELAVYRRPTTAWWSAAYLLVAAVVAMAILILGLAVVGVAVGAG